MSTVLFLNAGLHANSIDNRKEDLLAAQINDYLTRAMRVEKEMTKLIEEVRELRIIKDRT